MKKSIVLFTVLITSAASVTAHTLTLAEKIKAMQNLYKQKSLVTLIIYAVLGTQVGKLFLTIT